jgi:hypothetical protein
MPTTVLISGPIASGKTSVGLALQALMPGSVFIDGDAHAAPDSLSFTARWSYALWRIHDALRDALDGKRSAIIAWPLTPLHYDFLRDTTHERGGTVFCVTLCPSIDVVMTGRGRKLSTWEQDRITAMYAEGYHTRRFSDLFIDNAALDPQATAQNVFRAQRDADAVP